MLRPLPYVLALVLGVAAAVAVGCGDRSNLIPPNDAQALKDRAAEVQQATDNGDCAAAVAAVARAKRTAQALPSTVDSRLRTRINSFINEMGRRAPVDCRNAQTQTDTTTTVTTTTDTTPTVTTDTTPTTSTPTDTTTTPTDTTTTPADTTTTPTTTTPDGGTGGAGGAPSDGGVTVP